MNEITLNNIITPKHLFETMHRCGNGVRWKASVQKYEIDKLRWAATLYNEVKSGTYKTKGFKSFNIVERGKLRHIQSVHISERTVQKLFCEYALKPTIYPRLIYDNSANQPGKGTDFAIKRLREHLRWHYARYGKNGAVLTIDYSNYFGSISHSKVIEELSKGIYDKDTIKYIKLFINAFDGEKGLGLGSEISQFGAISYPCSMDKYIKEKLRVHCYGRYMDDSYIIHPDRKYVEYCLDTIRKMAAELGIIINERKTKIHNLKSDDFVFLKKRVRLTNNGKIIMRLHRSNIKRQRERITALRKEYDNGCIDLESINKSYQTWRNYAKKYNSYHTIGTMDKFFIKTMEGVI